MQTSNKRFTIFFDLNKTGAAEVQEYKCLADSPGKEDVGGRSTGYGKD